MTFHSCLYCLDVLHCQTYSIFITSTFSWSPCPHTYSTLSSLPDLPSPDAPSSLHFMPPLVWVLGDKECLCCAGVSSCVLLFLAGCRWAGTVSSALLAGPVCRSLKKFLLSSPLWPVENFHSTWYFWIPCSLSKLKFSWWTQEVCWRQDGEERRQCVHVNLVFIWDQAKMKVQSTQMCENKQVTLCTWRV